MIQLGKGQVSNITVYNSGAMVTRTARVSLQKGLNVVRFSELSQAYELAYEASSSFGKVISVCHESCLSLEYNGEYSGKIQELKRVQNQLKEQAALANRMQEFWSSNSKVGDKATDAELQARADFVKAKQLQLAAEIIDSDFKLNKITKELDELEKMANLATRSNTLSACVISIFAADVGEAQIFLSAYTSSASWQPLYRLEKDDEGITVQLQAKVTQNTQEDWCNLPISFVTGFPSRNSVVREFTPEYIGEDPVIFTKARMSAVQNDARPMMMSENSFDSSIEQTEGENTLEFSPAFDITVKQGFSAIIELNSYVIKASYEYRCFASVDTTVYLLAKILPQSFLAARASVYIKGVFVGATNVSGVMHELTLGREPRITIERIIGNRYKSNKLMGGNKTECDFKLKITSGKTQKVDINIIDRLPVSSNKSIEVTPTALSGGSFDPSTGKLEYALTLSPQDKKELKISYTITQK